MANALHFEDVQVIGTFKEMYWSMSNEHGTDYYWQHELLEWQMDKLLGRNWSRAKVGLWPPDDI